MKFNNNITKILGYGWIITAVLEGFVAYNHFIDGDCTLGITTTILSFIFIIIAISNFMLYNRYRNDHKEDKENDLMSDEDVLFLAAYIIQKYPNLKEEFLQKHFKTIMNASKNIDKKKRGKGSWTDSTGKFFWEEDYKEEK